MKMLDIGHYTPVSVFSALYEPGTSCLLESVSYSPNTGRYSIIATHPDFVYKGNSLDEVIRLLEKYRSRICSGSDLPFTGGAIGYIGYDTVRSWENIGNHAEEDIDIPDIYLLFYSRAVVFDHLLGKIFLINEELPCRLSENYREMVAATFMVASSAENHRRLKPAATKNRGFEQPAYAGESVRYGVSEFSSPFMPTLSKEAFCDMVLAAKEYIKEGDIYQANLSHRMEAEWAFSGWELYKRLRDINPSPFAGYMDLGGQELISCSPERLMKLEGNILETRPIAGTYPRGADIKEDRLMSYNLRLSPKERAEHIMLVDLERNDLGRVCEYGTVKPNEVMAIESYSHVHHIVSNIKGTLKKGIDELDIIKAMFPGGTITGCPKIRCMQIIDELEPVRRNVYTGSMGYFAYNGNMDWNIIIRTILKIGKKLYLQAGAGIVADSSPIREYYETIYKAEALLEAVTGRPKYGLTRISKR